MEISQTQLDGLRALRLHHWKGIRAAEREISKWEGRHRTLLEKKVPAVVSPGYLENAMQTLAKINKGLEHCRQVRIYQSEQVALLNTFFPIEDTVEKELSK